MTGHGPRRSPVIHLEVAGALDADVLESMVRFAHSTIRSGCAELVLQLHALTDFPTRLFSELHRLDQTARLHQCHLQLLGLDEAIATALCTSRGRGTGTG
jgi:hypothetical protein